MSPEQLQRLSLYSSVCTSETLYYTHCHCSLLLLLFIQSFPAWRRWWSSQPRVCLRYSLGQYDGGPGANGHLATPWETREWLRGFRLFGWGSSSVRMRTGAVVCLRGFLSFIYCSGISWDLTEVINCITTLLLLYTIITFRFFALRRYNYCESPPLIWGDHYSN